MARENPFTPGFGSTPPVMVGRDDLLLDFAEGLAGRPSHPARATVYVGARGVGKTVMLNAVEDLAGERGWVVIAESATAGFLERIVTEHLPAHLLRMDPEAVRTRLSGFTSPIGGLSWSTTDRHGPIAGFRTQLSLLTDLLAENGTGLLVTLDELHHQQFEEIREFATTFQHAVRENRPVAFAGAALPPAIEEILTDERITFLQRAERRSLTDVSPSEVARALREPIIASGRRIADAACERAALATGGYPFMIQLVGFHSWRQHAAAEEVSLEDVNAGVADALGRVGSLLYEPTLFSLSEVARTVLFAMARDDGPSQVKDLAERLGVDGNYLNQYRARLIAAGVIRAAGRGRVDFAMPDMRSYLQARSTGGGAGGEQ